MTMPADFVTLVETVSPVTALIGDRIFPLVTPQQVFDGADRRPCLVYRSASVQRGKTFCATDDLKSEAISVDCYAVTYDGAKALADALIAGVLDFSGVSGGSHFGAVFLENEFDLMDLEPGLYRRNLTFTVWHRSI